MIELHALSKTYGEVNAVENISLSIRQGEIYSLIGLNGAGKTTLIRLLLGLIKPTGGTSYINNIEVTRRNYRLWKDVGYLVETSHAYPELTVLENLKVHRQLRSITEKDAIERAVNLVNLSAHMHKRARDLSLGNKQRLGIAKALLHRPKILLLDEPTNGLDPAGIVEIRHILQDLAKDEGVTILISSHILDELAKFVTTAGILHEGVLIKEMKMAALVKELKRKLIIDTTNRPLLTKVLQSKHIQVKNHAAKSIEVLDTYYLDHPDEFAKLLINNDIPLTKLAVQEESLEQYFLRTIEEVEGKR